jgi:hypothetical protein
VKKNKTIGIQRVLLEAISKPSYMTKAIQPSKWEGWVRRGQGAETYILGLTTKL